ncbi:MAG: hypothetical protein AAB278_07400, partial [Pseudomonadota bacterium]
TGQGATDGGLLASILEMRQVYAETVTLQSLLRHNPAIISLTWRSAFLAMFATNRKQLGRAHPVILTWWRHTTQLAGVAITTEIMIGIMAQIHPRIAPKAGATNRVVTKAASFPVGDLY